MSSWVSWRSEVTAGVAETSLGREVCPQPPTLTLNALNFKAPRGDGETLYD